MPRPKLIRSKILPYHVTLRCNSKKEFPIPLDRVWKILEEELWLSHALFGTRIHAVVLMSNHLHLLFSTPEGNIDEVMEWFGRSTAKRINYERNQNGLIFGGPYYWKLIENTHYYLTALKYVYRNPVRAKLSMNVETYPYSTAQYLIGKRAFEFPLLSTLDEFPATPTSVRELDEWLSWLNQPFGAETESNIGRSLHKSGKTPLKDLKKRRPIPLNEIEANHPLRLKLHNANVNKKVPRTSTPAC